MPVRFPGGSFDIMKLTRAASYALHAVVYMAAQDSKRPVASHLIAHARGIPERFLLKVLKPLVSSRVLFSIKGPNGGYRLARPAREITMLEVVEAVDGPIRGEAPFTPQGNNSGGRLHHRLEAICDRSAAQMRQQLARVRISDLVTARKS
jgi:Rrf2 family protein